MGWTMSNDAGQITFSLLRCHSNPGCPGHHTNNATPCKCHGIHSVNLNTSDLTSNTPPTKHHYNYDIPPLKNEHSYFYTRMPKCPPGYNITPLKRRQPDGVKCGFIRFSPRLNRALLMEATAYLCNFYHRSKPNVGFIVAFIQSAILLLSKADFVNYKMTPSLFAVDHLRFLPQIWRYE